MDATASTTEERPTRGARLRASLERETADLQANVYAPECPSRSLLDHITSRWGVLVIVLLSDGAYRFSELATLIPGVSDKMLSQTLKNLTADGVIARTVSAESPIRVSYELTEPGKEVADRLGDLVDWLEGNALTLLGGEVAGDQA